MNDEHRMARETVKFLFPGVWLLMWTLPVIALLVLLMAGPWIVRYYFAYVVWVLK